MKGKKFTINVKEEYFPEPFPKDQTGTIRWTSQSGTVQWIEEMSDDHLQNVIKFLRRKHKNEAEALIHVIQAEQKCRQATTGSARFICKEEKQLCAEVFAQTWYNCCYNDLQPINYHL